MQPNLPTGPVFEKNRPGEHRGEGPPVSSAPFFTYPHPVGGLSMGRAAEPLARTLALEGRSDSVKNHAKG